MLLSATAAKPRKKTKLRDLAVHVVSHPPNPSSLSLHHGTILASCDFQVSQGKVTTAGAEGHMLGLILALIYKITDTISRCETSRRMHL